MPYSWPPTLSEAKDHLKLTDSSEDAQVAFFLDTAVELVINLYGGDIAADGTYTEWHDGGSGPIVLGNYPVTAVTSVTEYSGATSQAIASEPEDGEDFTGYGYRANLAAGMLYRTSGGYPASWTGRVKVVYTSAVPARVVFATLEGVRLLWTKARGMGATEYPVSLSDIDTGYLSNLLVGSSVGVA